MERQRYPQDPLTLAKSDDGDLGAQGILFRDWFINPFLKAFFCLTAVTTKDRPPERAPNALGTALKKE